MLAVQKKRAIYADLQALPQNVIGQILAGELHVQPRPASRHAWSAGRIGGVLDEPFHRRGRGPGGWIILPEPELHLGPEPDVLVPDLAGWRRTRMPELPDVAAFTLAPDWICEVLSPSTAKIDRTIKLEIYAREGVGHAWLVDPNAKTLEVYRLDDERWIRVACFADEAVVRAEPFDAIKLELSYIFLR